MLCFVHGTSCLTPPHRAIHRGRARRPPPTPKHRHIPTQGTCVKTRQLPKPHRTTTFCTKFGNFVFHTLCSKLSTCTGDVVFQNVPFANSFSKKTLSAWIYENCVNKCCQCDQFEASFPSGCTLQKNLEFVDETCPSMRFRPLSRVPLCATKAVWCCVCVRTENITLEGGEGVREPLGRCKPMAGKNLVRRL